MTWLLIKLRTVTSHLSPQSTDFYTKTSEQPIVHGFSIMAYGPWNINS